MSSCSPFNMTDLSQTLGEVEDLINLEDEISSQIDANGTSLQTTSHTVENAWSSGGNPKRQTTFSDLPAELRNMIWHEALAPRIIMIYPYDGRVETDFLNQVDFDKIPGMLFANQESRSIAQHHYEQRFTLTFTRRADAEGPGSLMCRIPVIMSSRDELAFSAHHLSSVMKSFPGITVSIKAADGAPTAWINRFSLLGDSLMREGINEHHLARLLEPDFRVWAFPNYFSKDSRWTTYWSPFGKQPDLRKFGPYLEDVESVCANFEYTACTWYYCSLEEWLEADFDTWCASSMHVMDRDGIDACVVQLPEPLSSFLGWE